MKNTAILTKRKFKSFMEFEAYLEDVKSNNDKGDAFEMFSYFYLLRNKEYFGIKAIYTEDDIPENLRKKYKIEPSDHGIDGLLIRTDDKVVGYQVKFRGHDDIPTEHELATFWAESEYTDFRMIIANCNYLPKVAYKKKNQTVLLRDSFINLDEEFFSEMYDYFTKNTFSQKTQKFKPYDYQDEIIEKIIAGFKNSDRGKLIAACGTGKTLTALWLQERMGVKNILYIVPNLALIKQTLEAWIEQKSEPFDFLCVCSDTTVISNLDDDEVQVHAASLGIPVTTASSDISEFLKKDSSKKIVFATYQSLDAIVNAMFSCESFSFDLAFFDESHRTAGTKDSQMFVYGIRDKYIPIKKRLFMTATERLVSPRIKAALEGKEDIIFSMDDEETYGKTFASLNFGEAIQKGIISDYKIVLCTVDEDDLNKLVQQNKIIKTEIGDSTVNTDTETLMKQILTAKMINELDVHKIISYHASVKQAKKFIFGSQDTLSLNDILHNFLVDQAVDPYLQHVNGTMSSGERQQILSTFAKSELGVVSNAKCLTEGVDIPVIDAVYFVDPKNSLVDIVQAIGRALRKPKDQEAKTSYILIPVVVPSNAENMDGIPESNFDTLHNVIQAMRDQDARLADTIDELNFAAARGQTRKSGHKIKQFVLTVSYSKINIEEFEDALHLRIAEVNKAPDQAKAPKIVLTEVKARKSDFKRKFVSIGDYTLDAIKNSIIIPTLDKFTDENAHLPMASVQINHNNVSHSERVGIIRKDKDGKYFLTNVGKTLYRNHSKIDSVMQRQLLLYCIPQWIFPYRAMLKISSEFEEISRFEFMYGIYCLQSTDDGAIAEAIERIRYLRDTYPNISILNEENKKKVLELINTKYDLSFNYLDIWTSRTTTYNQFNYFKKHLLAFDDLFVDAKDAIKRKENTDDLLREKLATTAICEKFARKNDLSGWDRYYTDISDFL